ncbi:MAG: hypothetical protein JWN79_1639 [Gemmatimonadetes bacterium]|nr:hypothetical protein [Gemmatimonadota bacterium]
MHTARPPARRLLLPLLGFLAACSRGPSREEALAAIRAAHPALDTATVRERVWQDGPPWFSCAEVIAKFTTAADSAAVRDQVGNWKPLVVHGWIVLKDSAAGPVADPGWCTVRVTPAGQANVARWTPSPGPAFPTGQARRGWMVVAGRRHLVVPSSPSRAGKDSATAEYLVTVAPNEDGRATGADRDTSRFVAALRREGGAWKVVGSQPAVPPAAR